MHFCGLVLLALVAPAAARRSLRAEVESSAEARDAFDPGWRSSRTRRVMGTVRAAKGPEARRLAPPVMQLLSQIPFRDSKIGRDGLPYALKVQMPKVDGMSMPIVGTREEYDLFAEQLLGRVPEKLERGMEVQGRVTGITRNNEAMVDIGTKSEAKISYEEATLIGDLRFSTKRMDDILTVGEEYEFEVLGKRGLDSELLLTRKPFLIEAAWKSVEEFAATEPSFTATVVKANMGGVLVTHPEFKGLTGFVPGSMIVNRPVDNESLVGTELKVKFKQADKEEQRIILSNRAVVQEEAMRAIKERDLVTGTVQAVMNFGVFVDVMGVRGMIHVSQVSGLFVDPPMMEKIFPIGGTVKAVATKTDFANGKLALSTRLLETIPGEIRIDPAKVFAGAEERHKALKEQWKLEEEARENERKELERQIMDLTMSVFDGAEASPAAPEDAAPPPGPPTDGADDNA